jgi:hypothetical protein
LNSRLMVASAVVMVGTVISSPLRAGCDRSFPLTCLLGSEQPADARSKDAPGHPRHAAKRAARAAKSSVHDRTHASARKAHHLRTTRAEPRAAPTAQARQMSASARRFREFVNPRSIVVNPVDELKRPQPDGAALAASVAYPAAAEGLTPLAGFMLDGKTFSQDEINGRDLIAADGARPIKVAAAGTDETGTRETGTRGAGTHGAGTAEASAALDDMPAAPPPRLAGLRGTVSADRAPGGPTWLQLIFVIWGGILTLASAVRLFVG